MYIYINKGKEMKKDKVLEIIESLGKDGDNPYVVRETLDAIQNLVIGEEEKKKSYKKQEYLIYGLSILLLFFPLFSFSFLVPLIGIIPLTYLTYKADKNSKRYQDEWKFIRTANISGLI